jgi:transcriptional regulator GlxA family with amidase domain
MKSPEKPLKVAILVCPNYAIMDVIGAHSVFGISPNAEVHLVWKDTAPLDAIPRFPTIPTVDFANCPDDLDVLVVGAIPPEVITDEDVLDFFRHHHDRGAHVIGVCGGALLLGVADLLDGQRATSNFHFIEALPKFGAVPVTGGEVVVADRIYTAGPATGSFEAALLVLAKLRGEDVAKFVELSLEYAPHPPFGVGSPELAGAELTAQALAAFAPFTHAAADAAASAYQRRLAAA